MWGHINDKIGFKKTYFMLLIIQLVTSLLIFNLRKNAFLYTIAVCASLLCEGGHFAIFPSACTKIFGF